MNIGHFGTKKLSEKSQNVLIEIPLEAARLAAVTEDAGFVRPVS